MKIRVLTIITLVVILALGAVSILLITLREDNGLDVSAPAYINIYKKNIKESRAEKDSEVYNDILKKYNEMTNLSYFSLLTNGNNLGQKITQDEKSESGAWSEFNKVNYYCIEMIFDTVQTQMLNINGNTKRIDFYSIIFKVEDIKKPTNIVIYYSSSESLSYVNGTKSFPLIVRGNTISLYNYINELDTNK